MWLQRWTYSSVLLNSYRKSFQGSQNIHNPVSSQLLFRKTLHNLPRTRKSRLKERPGVETSGCLDASRVTFLPVLYSELTEKVFLSEQQIFTFLNLQEFSYTLRCIVGSHRMCHAVNVAPQTNRKLGFLAAATTTHLISCNVSERCSSRLRAL